MDGINPSDRSRLYDLYKELESRVGEVNEIMRSYPSLRSEYERARLYWLASLGVGLNDHEFYTMNPTMGNDTH